MMRYAAVDLSPAAYLLAQSLSPKVGIITLKVCDRERLDNFRQ